uniref:Uncharacterized protein n=1 Tax=Cacopsylla melanoneura TaxID=428564 RepID=A0A8D8MFM6_9HEMI
MTNKEGETSDKQYSLADLMVAIVNVSSQVAELVKKFDDNDLVVAKRNEEIEQKLKSHEQRLDKQYKEDIRRNIIIYGWSEVQNDENHVVRHKLVELLTDKLQIQGVRSFDIHSIRIVGEKKNVVRATLCSPHLVQLAIRNSAKLAGSKIFLDFDLSPEERAVKKELLSFKRTLSAQGKQCKLKNKNLLMVDNQPFTVEQLKGFNEVAADTQTQSSTQSQIGSGVDFFADIEMGDATKKRTPPNQEDVQQIKKPLIKPSAFHTTGKTEKFLSKKKANKKT